MIASPTSHREALSPRSQVLLAGLASASWAPDFYLAGSAALALYLGHRPVADLDLMGATNRLTGPERRDLLTALLASHPDTQVETARDGYLYVNVGGVAVRFFWYPYPLVAPVEEIDGMAVASPADLGLMKLAAIISRGSRRDFADLYLFCQRLLPLAELLDLAADKFGHVRDFPLQALKGLADLSETVGEAMPRLAVDLAWEDVEAWLGDEVRREGRRRIGLT
jgi:Nucleotidyl transferase AbiEii toxin, Type IV TA system